MAIGCTKKGEKMIYLGLILYVIGCSRILWKDNSLKQLINVLLIGVGVIIFFSFRT